MSKEIKYDPMTGIFTKDDKVIRTGPSGTLVVKGQEYTVSSSSEAFISLCGVLFKFDEALFELATTLTPHKHQKEIIAWANGATIQYWWCNGERWVDKDDPLWSNDIRYRVKPDADNTAEVEAEIAELEAKLTKLKKDL
jgi:hypothetical protein